MGDSTKGKVENNTKINLSSYKLFFLSDGNLIIIQILVNPRTGDKPYPVEGRSPAFRWFSRISRAAWPDGFCQHSLDLPGKIGWAGPAGWIHGIPISVSVRKLCLSPPASFPSPSLHPFPPPLLLKTFVSLKKRH